MKALVIYRSKTGFVKKYAEWIAEELNAELVREEDVDIGDIENFDTIVFGGSLYAVGILGIGFVKKNLDSLEGKTVVVFATGASPARSEVVEEVRDKNLTKEEQGKVAFFYLRGGFDYDKLDLKDKMLMTMMKKKLEMKKGLTEDEKGLLEAYDEPVDFTDRENIKDLIGYVRERSG